MADCISLLSSAKFQMKNRNKNYLKNFRMISQNAMEVWMSFWDAT